MARAVLGGWCGGSHQVSGSGRPAASTPANLAEGFARYTPRDFARFVNIARSSLAETQNHLEHRRAAGYLSEERYRELFSLSCRAMAATARLHRHLRNRAAEQRR